MYFQPVAKLRCVGKGRPVYLLLDYVLLSVDMENLKMTKRKTETGSQVTDMFNYTGHKKETARNTSL